MIVDAVVNAFLSLVETVLGWLPDGETLGLGAVSSFASLLAEIDSLIPILPVITLALGLLSGLAVFIVIRVVLVVVNIVWW